MDDAAGDAIWERMFRAVEKVRNRLRRAVAALEGAGVPYAVVGGHAVASWVARVDEAAVRNTPDVNILLRRADLEAAKVALVGAGFVHRCDQGVDVFLDGPEAKQRDAVRIVFSGERVRADDVLPAPPIGDSELIDGFRVLAIEPLVVMKLTAHRNKDRVHIRDMAGVGLVDESWLARLPEALRPRLREVLDDPDG